MKKFVSIERKPEEILGMVEFQEHGVNKKARFSKDWSDDKVCSVFGITRNAAKPDKKENAK